MTDITLLAQALQPPVKRETIMEVLAQGTLLPKAARAMAFVVVQSMSQSDLDKLAVIAQQALSAAQDGDEDALGDVLEHNNVPPAMVKVVKEYARNINSK